LERSVNGADRSAFGLAIDVGEDGPCDAGTTPELDRIVGVVAHQDGLGDVADGDGLEACIPEKLTDPLRCASEKGRAPLQGRGRASGRARTPRSPSP